MQPWGQITRNILYFCVISGMFLYERQDHQRTVHPVSIMLWDNVSFHCGAQICRRYDSKHAAFLEANRRVFLCMALESLKVQGLKPLNL